MFSKTIAVGRTGLIVVLSSIVLLGQSIAAGPSSSSLLECPVFMLQKVTSGTTPVQTKVQAKLALATLVGRVVVPQGAILSGEVTESVPKSATNASRLGIRMDSAQWKNGSVPIKVYLTASYYPRVTPLQDLSPDPDPQDNVAIRPRRRRGADNSPYRNPSASAPGQGTGTDLAPAPPSPDQGLSKHRVPMKNVESTRNNDGAITVISKRGNIKLDKETAYVLAGNPLPAN
jgi:hypothetical protein